MAPTFAYWDTRAVSIIDLNIFYIYFLFFEETEKLEYCTRGLFDLLLVRAQLLEPFALWAANNVGT